MTRGVKVRLIAFVILSAVGVVYVGASYLGLVDKALGRGLHVDVTLPGSGGLFVGSEVTYRGFKIGKVEKMSVTRDGLKARLLLKQGTKLPLDSPVYVHNLSAIGEQYLDFEPTGRGGPYAENGDVIHGNAASLPESEDDLLTTLNAFVDSVNRPDLRTVVRELGLTFDNTARPLRGMVDNGTAFVDAAKANQNATFALLDDSQRVLQTQADNADNIRAFAKGLAQVSQVLKERDADLRTILQGGGSAAREVRSLLRGLAPTLPVFIGNLVTVNQVVAVRLPAVEQLLVAFPRVISSGFTGTPGDGYGHINIQTNYTVPACTDGYKPRKDWRPGTDLTDGPIYPARCNAGPPQNMRGNKYAPSFGGAGSANRPAAGATVSRVIVGQPHTIFGDDSWQWLLLGPAARGSSR